MFMLFQYNAKQKVKLCNFKPNTLLNTEHNDDNVRTTHTTTSQLEGGGQTGADPARPGQPPSQSPRLAIQGSPCRLQTALCLLLHQHSL